jgi:hypothetical protein
MRSSRLSVSLSAGIAALAAIFAGALIWLMLSDPITVADAVETGQVTPLLMELANVIYQALLSLLDYL